MSLWRKDAKRDRNEPQIVAALERVGAKVARLNVVDLLVLYRGRLSILDVKTAKGRPTKAQEAMIAAGWPLRYVRDEIEALRAIGAIR